VITNLCSMNIDPLCGLLLDSLPNAQGAIEHLSSRLVNESWGGLDADQVRAISRIADAAQRLNALSGLLGSSLHEDLYTEGSIQAVEAHLQNLDDALDETIAPYNIAMLARQEGIMRGEIAATEYDINWMRHELLEHGLMLTNTSYNDAHQLANEALGIEGDWDLWPTEIINEYPGWLIAPTWVEPLERRGGIRRGLW
jgi:hypothetical protein